MAQPDGQAQQGQAASWNARNGEVWAEQQALLDRLFLPFEQRLAGIVRASGARTVLDIGCGAGATTLAVARDLARQGTCLASPCPEGPCPDGTCTGLDISAPLVAAARRRAAAEGAGNARFILGDAQRHSFAPAGFDAVISRFGVMFFDAPESAFANIRRAVGPGAGLAFVAWRRAAENPFMIAAETAAAPILPALTRRDPAAPGQFAFGDADRVQRILAGSGWRDIDIAPLDVPCSLPETDLAIYATRMGRVGLLLPDLDAATRASVTAAVGRAFAPYLSAGAARFTAACWLVRARAG
ncbi:class I SAM-dependent methyltransferase [Methylobacterium sp. ID0610]|uniref:class I SAM-dependent methyltransferase n=1 Tax=Methylobacterium carpenticola TaxID=3344827 RepID=UPI0036AD4426